MSDAAVMRIGELAERLRAMPDAMDTAMPKLARVVDAYMRECYARGETPDGEPWAPTLAGRQPALEGTSVTVRVYGHHLVLRVTGHEAMHSKGTARGRRVRRMVPAGAIPRVLAERMRAVVVNALTAAATKAGAP